MNLFIKIFFTTVCLFILFFQAKEINSFSMPQPYSTDFNVELIPEYPEANQNVIAKITTYSFDLNSSYITWSLNGKITAQGKGVKSTKFQTGNIGSSSSLDIYIEIPTGQQIKKTIVIKIGEIDLLWQADTYTPDFYKGKAMALANSRITVLAIPHGFGAKNNLIYEWQRDYKNQPNVSGAGQDSFSFTFSDLFGHERITVKISDSTKTYSIEKTIVIRAKEPKILFYIEDPLKGTLFEKVIPKELSLLGEQEVIIKAEPYFFPKSDFNLLSYSWTMNNQPIEALEKPSTIGLLVPESSQGESLIKLEIKNAKKYLEQAAASFKVQF